MKKLQSYKKYGNQVRIDEGWWKILGHLKADTGMTLKALIEAALSNTYGVDGNGKPYVLSEVKMKNEIISISEG